MEEILTIDIIDNGRGGHDDLLFSIPDLIGDKKFDTYYFCLAVEPAESIDDIKDAVAQLLQYWLDKIAESKKGDSIYLPIEFSDQYTGCLKVQNNDTQLTLTYGISMREGYAVDPLNPGDYYKEINDFQANTPKQLMVDKNGFISAVDRQMQKLKKAIA